MTNTKNRNNVLKKHKNCARYNWLPLEPKQTKSLKVNSKKNISYEPNYWM